MFAGGFLLIVVAAWLADSAIQNRSPVATLEAILKNPASTHTILTANKGTAYKTAYATGGPVTTTTPATPSSADAGSPSSAAGAAVAYAEAQIGKPYVWGGTGPNGYDCSGLCYAAYKSAGVQIPRITAGQMVGGTAVARNALQAGDLVFPYPGHVFMYVAGGQCVEAPHTGAKVHMTNIYAFLTARRYT